jgi:arylsulfatase A-like enzyme
MDRRLFLKTTAAMLTGALINGCKPAFLSSKRNKNKPNFIVIMTDDQGWADLGVHPYRTRPLDTPNLDRIAKEGALFTDAYAPAPICSPSRAAFLTARYQQRFGYYDNWEAQVGFDADQMTIPQYLKPLGYKSAIFGKWHLGWFEHNHPLEMGFDYHFGFTGGMHDYVKPDEGETWQGGPFDANFMELNGKRLDKLDYMPNDITDHVIYFMEQTSEPFFIYAAYTTPHGPHQALDADLEKYVGDDTAGDDHRKVVRAMYDALDRNVGRILDYLEKTGRDKNTFVAFMADNGGLDPKSGCDNGPLHGSKGYLSEGGIRTCCAAKWPGVIPAGITYREPVINFDFTSTMLSQAGIDIETDPLIEGTDLIPYLQKRKSGPPHESLHWQMHYTDMGRWAVRMGNWKLVKSRNIEGLFNLRDDISETTDLTEKHPDIKEKLWAKHLEWHSKNQTSRVNDMTRRPHIWEFRFRSDMGEASYHSMNRLKDMKKTANEVKK